MRFITDPLATLLGFIISSVYTFFSNMGLESVALSIFILTLIIRLLLSPMNVQMTKSTRVQQHLKPEFDKINKKYKGKKDQNSMIKQQQETKDLQKRYGIKMSTGCLTTLIQFPIIIALYQVIREVAVYLPNAPESAYKLFAIDLKLTPSELLKADLWHNFYYAVIPILCCVFQVLSMISTPQTTSGDPQQDATAKSMRRSMMIMPIFSLFITFSVPSAVGFYWATSSLLSYLITMGTKIYFDHADMDKIVEKQRQRAEKKYEKDKSSGKKSFLEKLQEAALGESADTSEEDSKNMQQYSNKKLKNYSNVASTVDNADTTKPNTELKKGRLASKANAMARLNDKGDK